MNFPPDEVTQTVNETFEKGNEMREYSERVVQIQMKMPYSAGSDRSQPKVSINTMSKGGPVKLKLKTDKPSRRKKANDRIIKEIMHHHRPDSFMSDELLDQSMGAYEMKHAK